MPTASLLAALAKVRTRGVIASDISGAKLTTFQLWVRAYALAGALWNSSPSRGEAGRGAVLNSESNNALTPPSPGGRGSTTVGILLPTSVAALVTFLSTLLSGRVPAMLNFTSGERALFAACDAAELKTILTARMFIEKAELQPLVTALEKKVRIIYLEDVRAQLKPWHKIAALLKAMLKPLPKVEANQPAVVLFTSGSEGLPKGVVLSHTNLLSNLDQVRKRLSFSDKDVMFNCLPIFHSFGLLGGTLLPLIFGFRVYFYPTPLHYKEIPKRVREQGATILISTDTFFTNYARTAEAGDFDSLRLAVAGAEKLRDVTRENYRKQFNIEILEGYGVTECSPVLSVNTPEDNRAGTVGKVLEGIETKLEPVEGITEGGRLLVKGPNVMLGYLKADAPGKLQPAGEWYDTGDVVTMDAEGYIRIIGRAKRFAKVGGEMVSLAVVEECALGLWADVGHAAIAMPDARKGEQIVLITEQQGATREAFMAYAKKCGLSELAFPREVRVVEALPRLGSGKVDYVTLQKA